MYLKKGKRQIRTNFRRIDKTLIKKNGKTSIQ